MQFWPKTGACCCDEEGVSNPCCAGLVPTTLYLSDGLGTVPLVYGAPTPVTPSFSPATTWWGCATRTATGGAVVVGGSCVSGSTIATDIVFALTCTNIIAGFTLRIYHRTCGANEGGVIQLHCIESPGCSTPWPGHTIHVCGGLGGTRPPDDCSPFSTSYAEALSATPPYPPIREIYGGSATWTISE